MAYITRSVDDVESPFYSVKERCLTYLTSFVEGTPRDITEFMASNVKPEVVFNLMIRLVKKLTVMHMRRSFGSTNKKIVNYMKKTGSIGEGYHKSGTSTKQKKNAEHKKLNQLKEENTIITEIMEKAITITNPDDI